jgi:hypothetical protein
VGFADVTRLALQPSALDLEPAFGRAQFLRDLDRTHRLGTGLERQRLQQERADFDADLRRRGSDAARGFRSLTKEERRYRPSGNPNQYMLDAILRDNAVAAYDRDAPRLREVDRAARG